MRSEPDLHPLSLEDILTFPGRPRSGADYYKKHLFIRVLSHTLNQDGQNVPNVLEQIVRSDSPDPFELTDDIEGLPKYSKEGTRSSGFLSKFKPPHKSATIEPGGYDVENVDISKPPPLSTTYSSFYATHVRSSSFAPPRRHSLIPPRPKAIAPIRPFSSSCKNSGKVEGWM